ncbi:MULTISPECIES: cytochrome C oxidase subunit IV family protein [Desulfobacula]|uniref:CtaF: Caa(3)-type cytochrome c oxidase, subunit IV n=2 Tax=Desulfobacula TaxID=28222 RepID=K0NEY1_DESTT|nr:MULTISPECIES: cytochrome C oxidase subunit IV family protein [Desulfobacula]CCK79691.1 CtaF: Caa(3)-type cytochrome c oxidase, subunit IV [Desulfobacula toluolica Tol2]SDU34539.1 cytochrome c oxidase subunit 4 [Desulfobacula phenolica]
MENKPLQHFFEYKTLFNVLLVLLMFTGITVAVSFMDLGKLNVWITLLIASVKASFVLLFFMHMKFEGRVLLLSFLGTIFFLGIMISFTFWDVAFR